MHVVEAELMYINQAHFIETIDEALRTAARLLKMGATNIKVDGSDFGPSGNEADNPF